MCDSATCPAAKREMAKRMRELQRFVKRFVKNNPCPNYVSRDGVNGNYK